MTRSTSRTMRGLLLEAVAVLAVGGCRGEEVFVTPLATRIPSLGSTVCIGEEGLDTFIVDVFRFEGNTDADSGQLDTLCSLCVDDPDLCTPLSRVCRCSGPRNTPTTVEEALQGIRIEDLPPDAPICVRIVGLNTGRTGTTSGPGASCPADPFCLGPRRPDDARLCALSEVGAVNESGAPIEQATIACRPERVTGPDGVVNCDALIARCVEGSQVSCATANVLCVTGPLVPADCATFELP